MLNEEAASPPPSLPTFPQTQPPPYLPTLPQTEQSFRPPASTLSAQIISLRRSRLRLIYLGSGMALLCALAVFYVLFRQDHSPTPKARTTSAPVVRPTPAQVPVPQTPAPLAAPPKETVQPQAPASEPVTFKIRRSKLFDKVGPIRLRLMKANPKGNTCDLYVSSGGPAYQKRLRLNKPIEVSLPNNGGSAELVVTGIRTDQISGSLQQK